MTPTQKRAQELKIDLNKVIELDLGRTYETSALKWIDMIQNWLKEHNLPDARIEVERNYDDVPQCVMQAIVPKTDEELQKQIDMIETAQQMAMHRERAEYERLRQKFEK